MDADDIQPVGSGAGQHIQIHTAAQHMAVLVVGMVAANFGAARAAEQGGGSLRGGRECVNEALNNMFSAFACSVQAFRRAIQCIKGGQGRIMPAGREILQKLGGCVHKYHLIQIVGNGAPGFPAQDIIGS